MLIWGTVLGAWALGNLIPAIRRRLARPAARVPLAPPPAPVVPSVQRLLVDADEEAGVLSPTVELTGLDDVEFALLRIELVDHLAFVHPATAAPVFRGVGELMLHPFAPPDGATIEDVLDWWWVVVIEDSDGEVVRSAHTVSPAPSLNPEAELELAR